MAICMAGAAGHVLLDLASGVGVQLLWPFRTHWFEWDLAENLDPWILALLIAGFLLPQLFRLVNEEIGERKKGSKGRGQAVLTLLLLVGYLATREDLHSRAINVLLSSEYHGREPISAGAYPSATSLFEWRGVVSTDTTIEELDVPLGPGADFNSDRSLTHYKPDESSVLDAAESAPAARKFLNYARFPLATVTGLEAGHRFELRDLRFPSDETGPSNIVLLIDFERALQINRQEFRFASSTIP